MQTFNWVILSSQHKTRQVLPLPICAEFQSAVSTSSNTKTVYLASSVPKCCSRINWYFYWCIGLCIKSKIHEVSPQQGWERIINQSHHSKFSNHSHCMGWYLPQTGLLPASFPKFCQGLGQPRQWRRNGCAEAIFSSSHNGLLCTVSTLAWSAVLEGKLVLPQFRTQ